MAEAGPLSANGGTLEIFRGRGGSYEVVVGILPERPVVGTVHFSITPLDVSSSLPVTDAQILIIASDPRGEPTYQTRALNTPDSPQYYEANITFESPGRWELLVEVQSDQLGETTVTVPLELGEPPFTPSAAGAVVFFVLVLVLIGGSVYVWHSGRRQRRAASG